MRNASPHDIAQARAARDAALADAKRELETALRAQFVAREKYDAACAELEDLRRQQRGKPMSKLPPSIHSALVYLLLLSWPVALVLAIGDFGKLSLLCTGMNSLIGLVLTLSRAKASSTQPPNGDRRWHHGHDGSKA